MNYPNDTLTHITAHIASLTESKSSELLVLYQHISALFKNDQLWFDDGKNSAGKVVTNPTIGFGNLQLETVKGKTKDVFQVGLSAHSTGISVYIIGLKDKTLLNQFIGNKLGKAKITGYCINFKSLKDIDLEVLISAIQFGISQVKELK
ncbi:MAG: DUF1801 domain-containing protein [Crocinitomicaceae bacterium]|nr:DUF1801 domain-containing protein [Crocinitomicaceae bacterium]